MAREIKSIIPSKIKITRHREINISPPEKKEGVVQVKPPELFAQVKVIVSVCIFFLKSRLLRLRAIAPRF